MFTMSKAQKASSLVLRDLWGVVISLPEYKDDSAAIAAIRVLKKAKDESNLLTNSDLDALEDLYDAVKKAHPELGLE